MAQNETTLMVRPTIRNFLTLLSAIDPQGHMDKPVRQGRTPEVDQVNCFVGHIFPHYFKAIAKVQPASIHDLLPYVLLGLYNEVAEPGLRQELCIHGNPPVTLILLHRYGHSFHCDYSPLS